jgi:hypothetical protein
VGSTPMPTLLKTKKSSCCLRPWEHIILAPCFETPLGSDCFCTSALAAPGHLGELPGNLPRRGSLALAARSSLSN